MSKNEPIKILFGGLQDDETSTSGIILRGVVAPESLRLLRIDNYQREIQPMSSRASIMDAFEKKETLPDIVLGMRGQNFHSRENNYFLDDPVYIVDGLQRQATALYYMEKHCGSEQALLGATVHFDTSFDWERRKFHILNSSRLKMSPNIILRNMRSDSPVILSLYGLSTNDKAFVLHDRVCWQQKMKRTELITANSFTKTAAHLHSHKISGKSGNVTDRVASLESTISAIGIQALRDNIKMFFSLVGECWGVKTVQYRATAVHMKETFLWMLARILSDHYDFWPDEHEKRLFVAAPLKRKIAKFPLEDPEVRRLATAGGAARYLIYSMMRDHINSGKRTKHLHPRKSDIVAPFDIEEDNDSEEEAA